MLKRVESNGRHLLGLINDVLDLSKIEAGQLTLDARRLLDAETWSTTCSARSSRWRPRRSSRFKVDVPPDLPPGHGDERTLTQVLLNLVGNAIKFTDAGEVAIKVAPANGSFRSRCATPGPGIAAADQAKIFEEFQQADNSITQGEGRHRARARHLASASSRCTAAASGWSPARATARPSLRRFPSVVEHRRGHMSKRILVVEDQEDNMQILRDLLAAPATS